MPNNPETLDSYREQLFNDLDRFSKDNIFGSLQKLFLGRFRDYDVYSVNGAYVKILYDINFVEGGNFRAYSYIPDGEIWIDNNLDNSDMKFTLSHEYYEAEAMKEGLGYDNPLDPGTDLEYAHPQADFFIELPYRKREIA